jgi:hypothetical protein
MGFEYRTGHCNNCNADKKLERKKVNHLVHFLITIVLGIFTYGIGSMIWIVVWYLISEKFNSWSCHVCGSKDCEAHIAHLEHLDLKHTHPTDTTHIDEKPKLIEKLKKLVIFIGLFAIAGAFVFFFVPDVDENKQEKQDKESTQSKTDKQSEENSVSVTVDLESSQSKNEKKDVEYNKVGNDICYVYHTEIDLFSISGFLSCKKGKLTINFYDRKSNSIVDRKTIPFDDNKFYLELDNPEKNEIQFSISLLKDQITERLYQIKEQQSKGIPSVKPYDTSKIDQCEIKNWEYTKYFDKYLLIEGTTTCNNEELLIKIYGENNEDLGSELSSIESGKFKVFLKTNSNPTRIQIEHTSKK